MKYKKQIATGALAFSLLIGGSNVFAATPQDLGIKKMQPSYQKQSKVNKNIKGKKEHIIGTIGAINSMGFVVEIKNLKTKTTSGVEVNTDTKTIYTKNGMVSTVADLAVGEKVIVIGNLDKTANTITAKTVKIVTNAIVVHKAKKVIQ